MWILPGLIWLIGLTLWPVMACGQPAGEVRELQTVVIDPGHGEMIPELWPQESAKKTWCSTSASAWAG